MNTICFFNTTKTWGGGEKWHYEIALEMFRSNFKILMIVSENSDLHKRIKELPISIETITVNNLSYLNLLKVQRLKKTLKKHKVQTVIMNSSEDMKLGGLAAKKAAISTIIYRRGSAIPIKNTFVNRYFFSNVITNILANSDATKKTINENNSQMFPEQKITVIPNGIDTESFLRADYKPLYIRKGEEFIIGNLGRLVPQKNQEFLIDVVSELKKRNLKIKLIIGGEGKLRKELMQKTIQLNLEKEIEFFGFVKTPKNLMHSIDIFILSSLWEGFGYVIAEAMLCEKPVLAFNISSNPELVKDTKNGYLTTLNEVNEMCNKIEELYNNTSLIKELGTNGKELIITKFDIKYTKQKVREFILAAQN
jgi:glycosyltransferase involved in cell wall biosynthesis